jgi:hypothetical protein
MEGKRQQRLMPCRRKKSVVSLPFRPLPPTRLRCKPQGCCGCVALHLGRVQEHRRKASLALCSRDSSLFRFLSPPMRTENVCAKTLVLRPPSSAPLPPPPSLPRRLPLPAGLSPPPCKAHQPVIQYTSRTKRFFTQFLFNQTPLFTQTRPGSAPPARRPSLR